MVRVRSAVQIRSRAPYDKADMKISAFVLMACLVWLAPGLLVGLQRVRGDRSRFRAAIADACGAGAEVVE